MDIFRRFFRKKEVAAGGDTETATQSGKSIADHLAQTERPTYVGDPRKGTIEDNLRQAAQGTETAPDNFDDLQQAQIEGAPSYKRGIGSKRN